MLDSRFPKDVEKADEEYDRAVEKEVARLIYESQIWRLANSAQWVMWGVMQAKIEGLPDFDDETQRDAVAGAPRDEKLTSLPEDSVIQSDSFQPVEKEPVEVTDGKASDQAGKSGGDNDESEEFDYLAYTFERAMFFWGDAVELGLVRMDELPAEVRENIKLVDR
jgi:choline kinase